MEGVRLVLLADTHLFHEDLRVPDGDVIVHAGDACRRGTLDELVVFAALWRALPHAHKVFVPGNHEWCFQKAPEAARALLPGTHVLIDEALELGGLRWYGSPWQPEFGRWAFNLPRGPALAERWACIPDDTDVLITHGPPLGLGDRSRHAARHAPSHGAPRLEDGHTGCADLRARVASVRPRLHAFGHIHEDGGLWSDGVTLTANVTTWECERACTVIDVGPRGTLVPVVVPPRRVGERSTWP